MLTICRDQRNESCFKHPAVGFTTSGVTVVFEATSVTSAERWPGNRKQQDTRNTAGVLLLQPLRRASTVR